jgi:hypothetical protein
MLRMSRVVIVVVPHRVVVLCRSCMELVVVVVLCLPVVGHAVRAWSSLGAMMVVVVTVHVVYLTVNKHNISTVKK